MSTNIITILGYLEIHDLIIIPLKNDLNTLYSCIRVNRSFCRIFIPILWRNPFKFIKDEKKLIPILHTLIHCLAASDITYYTRQQRIPINNLPTQKTFFKYNTLMREFELNTLQKGRRLWDEKYLKKTKSVLKKDRKVSKFNHYLGNLFFSQE